MKKYNNLSRMLSLALSLIIIVSIFMRPTLEVEAATDYSAVFDATYYKTHNPDLAAAGITSDKALLNHFINSGMKEGRQGNEEFNVYAYKNRYADLQTAFGNDLKKYYLHYINSGKAEGRNGRADGVVTTPTNPTNPSNPGTSNTTVKNTSPTYYVRRDIGGWGSWLTVKPGQSNGHWTATQADITKANSNPYGRTEGYSVLTGYAKIGDVRYLNFNEKVPYMSQNGGSAPAQFSVAMECYAINKNGVPLFRKVGSSYNVYTKDTNLLGVVDAVTPSTTVTDLVKMSSSYNWNTYNCNEFSNILSVIYTSFMVEHYTVTSAVYNHAACFVPAGNGCYYTGSDAHIQNLYDYTLSKNGQKGTFVISYVKLN